MTAARGHRERVRAAMLDDIRASGLAQIAAGGPQALSLSQIARDVGISQPAIYHYYSSREELISAIVLWCSTNLSDVQERAWRSTEHDGPAVRLRAVADASRRWALDNPGAFKLAFSTISDVTPDNARVTEIMQAGVRGLAYVLAAVAAFELPGDTVRVRAGSREYRVAATIAAQWSELPDVLQGVGRRALTRSYLVATYLWGLITFEDGRHQITGEDATLWTLALDRLVTSLEEGREPL